MPVTAFRQRIDRAAKKEAQRKADLSLADCVAHLERRLRLMSGGAGPFREVPYMGIIYVVA